LFLYDDDKLKFDLLMTSYLEHHVTYVIYSACDGFDAAGDGDESFSRVGQHIARYLYGGTGHLAEKKIELRVHRQSARVINN